MCECCVAQRNGKALKKGAEMTPHDDYYYNLADRADEKLARAAGAVREPTNCSERFDLLASVFGHKAAAVIEAFIDGRVAHHELNEHKA
jgi:hypothetical protein